PDSVRRISVYLLDATQLKSRHPAASPPLAWDAGRSITRAQKSLANLIPRGLPTVWKGASPPLCGQHFALEEISYEGDPTRSRPWRAREPSVGHAGPGHGACAVAVRR